MLILPPVFILHCRRKFNPLPSLDMTASLDVLSIVKDVIMTNNDHTINTHVNMDDNGDILSVRQYYPCKVPHSHKAIQVDLKAGKTKPTRSLAKS